MRAWTRAAASSDTLFSAARLLMTGLPLIEDIQRTKKINKCQRYPCSGDLLTCSYPRDPELDFASEEPPADRYFDLLPWRSGRHVRSIHPVDQRRMRNAMHDARRRGMICAGFACRAVQMGVACRPPGTGWEGRAGSVRILFVSFGFGDGVVVMGSVALGISSTGSFTTCYWAHFSWLL